MDHIQDEVHRIQAAARITLHIHPLCRGAGRKQVSSGDQVDQHRNPVAMGRAALRAYAAHVAANQPYHDTWRFKPSCKTGPCGAVWTAAAYPGIRAGLSFKGKTYQGTSNDAVFAVTCNGVHIPSIVTMHITQIHSKLAGGKWKVVSFSGWIYVVVPSSTNCSSGQFSNTFTAHA